MTHFRLCRKNMKDPQQNVLVLSERKLSMDSANGMNTEICLREEGCESESTSDNVLRHPLTELDSQDSSSISHFTNNTTKTVKSQQTYCSDSSSSDSYCGIPIAISALPRPGMKTYIMKTKSKPLFSSHFCDETTAVDRLELSHEERRNMIKQLLISDVAGSSASKIEIIGQEEPSGLHSNGTSGECYDEESLVNLMQHPGRRLKTCANYYSSSCSICQSYYQHGEHVSVNPYCNHIFHEKCLLKWLILFNKCPCCREPFLRSIS